MLEQKFLNRIKTSKAKKLPVTIPVFTIYEIDTQYS